MGRILVRFAGERTSSFYFEVGNGTYLWPRFLLALARILA